MATVPRCAAPAARAAGHRIGLLTNGTEEQQLDKLAVTGLAGAFDVVCVSERIGHAKPDPAAFRALAEGLGVHPSDCLFVGDDARLDVAGARFAGMAAVLVDPGVDAEHSDADSMRDRVLAALADT